jgi:hypothetical protein
MAFITLRRSRNTSNYYLVESYRDEQGRSRKRTLCYLGRELDGTGTLAKALLHWEKIEKECRRELRSAKTQRKRVVQDRLNKARQRLELLREHAEKAIRVESERQERRRLLQAAEEVRRHCAEEAEHWQAIERLHSSPSAEHAQAAKRAFPTRVEAMKRFSGSRPPMIEPPTPSVGTLAETSCPTARN